MWPLAIPGVFAAFLLTFVPAVGDYVNASILGGPGNTMIGNVIQTQFLTNFDYPIAAALSFILMAALLVGRHPLLASVGHRGRSRTRRDDERAAPPPPAARATGRRRGADRRGTSRQTMDAVTSCRTTRGSFILYLFVPIVVMIVVQLQHACR